MKIYSVEFQGLGAEERCLIIAANDIHEAIEITKKTLTHTDEFEIFEVDISNPVVIVYLSGESNEQMKTEKTKTAQEILYNHISAKHLHDHGIDGGAWMQEGILAAMEEYKNQPTEGLRLPTKDEAVDVGFTKAKNADYNFRKVLSDLDHDIYYSGWMDCFDWTMKQIQSLNQKRT